MDPSLAHHFGITVCTELLSFPYVRDKIAVIPYGLAKHKKVLPLEETSEGITVAVTDILDLDVIQELKYILKKNIVTVCCSVPLLETAIERCYQQKEEETKQFFSDLEKEDLPLDGLNDKEEYDLLEQSNLSPVIRMVNTLLVEAITQGASDIHFEPTEEGLSIRYRIDGVLLKRHEPPKEYQLQIVTRIKVMAKMDIAEHRLPQDGRIKLRYGGRDIDFRVSTLPIVHGERIVLRILDKGNVLLGLDRIGMPDDLLKMFRKLIHAPEGIVLVTGPTGSGKTTTLYSALSELNASEMNIVTIEDPVEYKLSGISQMNVNRKIELDFSKGLRHILRQDPDVIMIGEIRDRETADIAIQSSLTGHLVLSTLHTNDAPSALTRLADMGIEPYLLASSILGVIAQRLVRKICTHCSSPYDPLKEELAELGIKKDLLSHGKLFKGAGCLHCYGTGYRGRCGIYELMPMTSKIKLQVLKSLDAEELRKVARNQQMTHLFQGGIQLILQGVTTVAEVLRVTRVKEEEG